VYVCMYVRMFVFKCFFLPARALYARVCACMHVYSVHVCAFVPVCVCVRKLVDR